jgi:hypothetical protein
MFRMLDVAKEREDDGRGEKFIYLSRGLNRTIFLYVQLWMKIIGEGLVEGDNSFHL